LVINIELLHDAQSQKHQATNASQHMHGKTLWSSAVTYSITVSNTVPHKLRARNKHFDWQYKITAKHKTV